MATCELIVPVLLLYFVPCRLYSDLWRSHTLWPMHQLIEIHLNILAASLPTLRKPFCSTKNPPEGLNISCSSQEKSSDSTKAAQLAIATRMDRSSSREQLSEIRNVVTRSTYGKRDRRTIMIMTARRKRRSKMKKEASGARVRGVGQKLLPHANSHRLAHSRPCSDNNTVPLHRLIIVKRVHTSDKEYRVQYG